MFFGVAKFSGTSICSGTLLAAQLLHCAMDGIMAHSHWVLQHDRIQMPFFQTSDQIVARIEADELDLPANARIPFEP